MRHHHWIVRGMALALFLLLGAVDRIEPATAEEAAKPPGAGRNLAKDDPALQKEIDGAIERGAKWLASLQKKDGAFGMPKKQVPSLFEKTSRRIGLNALVLYTLAHCGYDKDDKVVKRSVQWMRKRYGSLYKGDYLKEAASYSLAIWVLALHRLYAEPAGAAASQKVDRYGKPTSKKKNPCSYPKWVRRAIWDTLDWMLKNRSKKGLFRYPGGLANEVPAAPATGPDTVKRGSNYGGPEDLSCSQYVLLAFWVGTRCGYEIPKDVLKSIATRLLSIQEKEGPEVARVPDPIPAPEGAAQGERYAKPEPRDKEGKEKKDQARGFGYTPGDGATGAMTTAGLSSLMIVKAIMEETRVLGGKLRSGLDAGIWDGIAWLQKNYSVEGNHPLGTYWHYYYLYGLERALVIADKRLLGEHDWYVEGAKLLLEAQSKEGRWSPSGPLGTHAPAGVRIPIADTCFALLFLKRAAFQPKRPTLQGPVVTGGPAK